MRVSVSAVASLLVATSVGSLNNAGRAVAFVPVSKNVAWTSMRMTASSETEAAATSSMSASSGRSELDEEYVAVKDAMVSTIQAAVETKSLIAPLTHFVEEYFAASNDAARAGSEIDVSPQKVSDRVMNSIQLGMKYGLSSEKYIFDVRHKALRGDPEQEDGNTYDFYEFGCDFFRAAIDLKNSVVRGQDNIEKALAQMEAGENVVFLANHQSEADPQVFSIMLESIGRGDKACDVTYVAGHKVTTDPLAIPFSMGRNLLCIHSKKHINADPDSKAVKQRQNLAAMSSMLEMMKAGGASLWVAPSGGRDRRDTSTGEVPIAPFDQKTVDMFRLMGNKSKKPTHFYPLSMVTYDLCPPPDFIDPGVGEQRNVRFVPVAINVMDEVENVGGVESRHLFTEHAEEACRKGYNELLDILSNKKSD